MRHKDERELTEKVEEIAIGLEFIDRNDSAIVLRDFITQYIGLEKALDITQSEVDSLRDELDEIYAARKAEVEEVS